MIWMAQIDQLGNVKLNPAEHTTQGRTYEEVW